MRTRCDGQCALVSRPRACPVYGRSAPGITVESLAPTTFICARSWVRTPRREHERACHAHAAHAARADDRRDVHPAGRVRVAERARDLGAAGVGWAYAAHARRLFRRTRRGLIT